MATLKDSECIAFLQWALPRLRMQWAGFRKVRRQVCKRVQKRIDSLHLPSPAVYREYLNAHVREWDVLDQLCRITISRFYRDRGVYEFLGGHILPELAERANHESRAAVRAWSVGCGSGEEPYSLALLWLLSLQPPFQKPSLQILATDVDDHLLRRAQRACYTYGSVKDLPEALRKSAFEVVNQTHRLRARYTKNVVLVQHDIRRGVPGNGFDLILCRNLVFTYFNAVLQRTILRAFIGALLPNGILVLGIHERLPGPSPCLEACSEQYRIYKKVNGSIGSMGSDSIDK